MSETFGVFCFPSFWQYWLKPHGQYLTFIVCFEFHSTLFLKINLCKRKVAIESEKILNCQGGSGRDIFCFCVCFFGIGIWFDYYFFFKVVHHRSLNVNSPKNTNVNCVCYTLFPLVYLFSSLFVFTKPIFFSLRARQVLRP